jgi:hypothetical protein
MVPDLTHKYNTSGLYYKHFMIVTDNSSIVGRSKLCHSSLGQHYQTFFVKKCAKSELKFQRFMPEKFYKNDPYTRK